MLFTRAPDRARKQLLETVLGLERFDRALQRCREDLRAVETVVQGQRDLLTRRKEQRANENRRASEAEMNLRLLPPVADLEDLKQRRIGLTKTLQDGATEIAALRASVADLLSDRRDAGADAEQRAHEIQARGQAAAGKARELRGEVRVLERQLAEMKGSPAMCSTCRRPFDKDPEAEQHQAARRADQEKQLRRVQRAAEERELEATQLKKDMTSPLVEAERLRQAAEVENRRLTSEQNDAIADLDEEAAAMRRKITRLSEQISVAVATGQQRLVLEKTIADSSDRIEELGAAVVELEAAVVARTRETALLTSVEQVLGLRGVRAQILGDALASIEAFGNAQLDRLSPDRPLRLKLRSYREKADGKGVTDAISLDVEGAAGGRGYRGASGGERRRLDVAILLAIAEVAQAAAGQEGGTLFFDEALDALDADGVEAVASMLTDLAATRAVFLITHNQDLVQRLRAVLRVTMVAKNVAPAAQPGEIMAPATSQGE